MKGVIKNHCLEMQKAYIYAQLTKGDIIEIMHGLLFYTFFMTDRISNTWKLFF